MSQKLAIEGDFSKDKVEEARISSATRSKNRPKPKYMIQPHPGFEIVALPGGKIAKLAFNKLYEPEMDDLEIELAHINRLELMQKSAKGRAHPKELKRALKYHYKRAASIISPDKAAGWNRWSDNILDLFISDKIHKVCWGSGNCGKSVIFALLLYIKWRVKPHKRMVVLASRVMKEASTRVFAYIKDIHLAAPSIRTHKVKLVDGVNNKGIYTMLFDKDRNAWVLNERACIVSLPIKVKVHKGSEGPTSEIGGNLLGKHPEDELILAFDEAQELPGALLGERIFANWYTNMNLHVYAWGNPMPINFHDKNNHDMLFKLGAGESSLQSLRIREKKANQTSAWVYRDTMVLHLSMIDSPKDDPDEVEYKVLQDDGTMRPRLHFLAGKDNADRIARKASPNSPAWYSQVLGFPFIETTRDSLTTVLAPHQIKASRDYPLIWKNPDRLIWFMGVDPSITGHRDKCAISVGKMGAMTDGRLGIDFMNGKFCEIVQPIEGRDFADLTVESMWRISQTLKIPLQNIGIETHGSGEVIRYAIQKHIEEKGKWSEDVARGATYHVISPNAPVTDRHLFKTLGRMQPAKDVVADCQTEYWVAARCGVLTRQIFNLPEAVLRQFYGRLLEHNSSMTKYKLESKDKYRARGEGSPDEADAMVNCLEVMRRSGFKYYYYAGGKNVDKFGQAFTVQQQEQKATQRLGRISELLQVGINMESFGGPRKKKKVITWQIETV